MGWKEIMIFKWENLPQVKIEKEKKRWEVFPFI
jgi:hypothetical protein